MEGETRPTETEETDQVAPEPLLFVKPEPKEPSPEVQALLQSDIVCSTSLHLDSTGQNFSESMDRCYCTHSWDCACLQSFWGKCCNVGQGVVPRQYRPRTV